MTEQSQSEAIDFLCRLMRRADGIAPQILRTHGATLLLGRTDAYKIKRALRYDYLDFSTQQKRHDMLQRELDLNRPRAASIYRDVIAVTRNEDGGLRMGGGGQVVEWVLRMHRFDTANELSQVAQRGALSDDLAADLGTVVARYHDAAPVSSLSGAALIDGVLNQVNAAFADMTDLFGAGAVARYSRVSRRAFCALRPQMDARGAAGHVRRCHGDLHLGNIVLMEGAPVLFDALEFSETLGTCDVLYDLAFLLMDLDHKGLRRAANIVLNSYLSQRAGAEHLSALGLLPLFQSLRAAVRAMVSVQAEKGEEARGYLAHALRCLKPPLAWMIAIGGRSGTGKSVLAASLAPLIGAAPGAVHLRSDLERKAYFGVAPLVRLPESAYTPDISARICEIMRNKARQALAAGHGAVLDATWLGPGEGAALEQLARQTGVPFTGLWLTAGSETLVERVSARRGDASDADAAVVRNQTGQGPAGWECIDAGGSRAETLHRAAAALNLAPVADRRAQDRKG
ncbi:MAG: AAA family ATPase [Rhodobacterales bacterium]|nr:AAA family ATPase [Rhodobacterales bacterium]